MFTTRRSFLVKAVSPLAFSFVSVPGYETSTRQIGASDFARLRSELLSLVNAERMTVDASPLALDDLASLVADQHAFDMAKGKFLSHWGRDGRKPYQRYADAEGIHAVQENVSAAGNIESPTARYAGIILEQMHVQMFGETPPNDGHRQTMLAYQHSHVGFGIALADRDLRLVELYVGKHIELEPFSRRAKRKSTIQLHGRLINAGYDLSYAEVFFEPNPSSPEMSWLREPRPYSLPSEYRTVRVLAPKRTVYADGVAGEIEVGAEGRFRIPVHLYKNEPGTYTIVIWLSEQIGTRKFGATNICIRVD